MNKKVVVTGYGIICTLGEGKEEVKLSLMSNNNKMSPLSVIKDYGVLNDIKVGRANLMEPKLESNKDLDKSEIMARKAIIEACKDANLTKEEIKEYGQRISMSLATSVMGSDYIQKFYHDRQPEWLVNTKVYASRLAREFNIRGSVYTTSSACASGTASLGVAYDLIYEGKNDIVICGGTDHISDISVNGFYTLSTLSNGICKPFDMNRDGINIGEGSAFFVFEEYEHAMRRGARIYGEVVGYGLANDGYHITSPDPSGEGAYYSMKEALSSIPKTEYDDIYVNAHGTGTHANDTMEYNAIKKMFPDTSIYLSSTKALTGHCLGAAGSIEFAFCLLFLQENHFPMTANSNCDMIDDDLITMKKEDNKMITYCLSNSFAFGGNDATIVIKKEQTNNDE